LSISTSDSIVLVGTVDGLYFSKDHGTNLSQTNFTHILESFNAVAILDEKKFLAAGDHLYVSDDSARTWYISSIPFWQGAFLASCEELNLLFTSTDEASRSSDFGDSWTKIETPPTSFLGYFAIAEGKLFSSGNLDFTKGGIFESQDLGLNWTVNRSLKGVSMGIASIKRSGVNDLIFVCSRKEGVLVSSNLGNTWEPRNSGFDTSDIIQVATIDNLVLVLDIQGRCYKSTNYGESWTLASEGLSGQYARLHVDEKYAYIGGVGTGLWRRSTQEFLQSSIRPAVTKAETLIAYPNPCNSTATIELPFTSEQVLEAVAYNALGQEIHREHLSPNASINEGARNSCELNVSSWPSGPYLISIRYESNVYYTSLVKQ
jgi:photosystem II stability/assembly factor-like uncharacterized protein